MAKNVIVAQSGGPTPVINSSLRGVIEGCRAFPETFGTVYAGWHGIEGVLKEELLNLSGQDEEEIALLRYTPAAGSIGSCRYKLKSHQNEDFDRIIDVFRAHNAGYFFYNGGNDSMDTCHKVAQMAHDRGLDLVAVGVPKTIDNDVGDSGFKLIDHTPGYGSVARYWMGAVQNANEENAGSCPSDPVLVLQAMGRKIGYIPAAARLADPKREMPLQIYMAESKVTAEQLCDNVNEQLRRDGRCIVVVSEGFDVGELGALKDSFGHAQFGASKLTVAQKVVNLLNDHGLAARGAARGQVYGTDQRDTCVYASIPDLDEAFNVGLKAVEIAASGENGWMSTVLRNPGLIYSVRYDKVPLKDVANSERTFPAEWIAADGTDVSDEFVKYAKPLIGEDWASVPVVNGRQRFSRLKPVFAEKRLGDYELQAVRLVRQAAT
ncbi:MAG: diphosphate--fructose-6-phosphate 1-phosphotransferase [Candidatus Hydrogenedentes bacterium]|nr:diphosphate--fructose-6-phosphate 1-phosphotransferase [Candidatus Hydrogenedentota bacterium]